MSVAVSVPDVYARGHLPPVHRFNAQALGFALPGLLGPSIYLPSTRGFVSLLGMELSVAAKYYVLLSPSAKHLDEPHSNNISNVAPALGGDFDEDTLDEMGACACNDIDESDPIVFADTNTRESDIACPCTYLVLCTVL